MKQLIRGFVALSLVLAGAAPAMPQVPIVVSPGSTTAVAPVEARCPTFSWAGVREASAYELLVYRIGTDLQTAETVLREILPGSALSWTPSLDRCLERGRRYAWSVRALTAGQLGAWSAPSLFVVAGPSEVELQTALAVVQRHLSGRREPTVAGIAGGAAARPGDAKATTSPRAATAAVSSAPVATVLSVDGNVDASSFTGDGSGLSQVDAETLDTLDSTDIITGVKTDSGLTGGGSGGDVVVSIAVGGVSASHLGDDSVHAAEIAMGAVSSAEVLDNSLTSADLAQDSVGSSEIATNAVGTLEIAAGAVGSSELAWGAVIGGFGGDILDNSITQSDIAANAVGESEIAFDAVSASEIQANAVRSSELASQSVRGHELANIYLVGVECNAACADGTLSNICATVAPDHRPIFVICQRISEPTTTVPCGGDDNRCRSLLLTGSSSVGTFCDPGSGLDAIVGCIPN